MECHGILFLCMTTVMRLLCAQKQKTLSIPTTGMIGKEGSKAIAEMATFN